MRLDASACIECGGPRAQIRDHGCFCAPACRTAFNNRRAKRGAEIYDLFMALRYDRTAAKALKVWTLLCRAATLFRDEDRRDRAGRPSWSDPKRVIAGKPFLRATILIKARATKRAA